MNPIQRCEDAVHLAVAMLRSGWSIRFSAEGHSMSPTVKGGDALKVAPGRGEHMALGDIVLCLVGKRLLAHRVVKRTPLGLTIRGDSHRSGEDCIGFDQVLGRVMHVERSSLGRRGWARWMAAKAKISRLWAKWCEGALRASISD